MGKPQASNPKSKTSTIPIEPFPGFTAQDFDVFLLPEFAERMPRLKAQITPKLRALGVELLKDMEATVEETLYPHVAQHIRRTVNPPIATWVAFARTARSYKPTVHLRVAIQKEGINTLVFVEDYAEDKVQFIEGLEQNAQPLAELCSQHPEITAYDMKNSEGQPCKGAEITVETIQGFAQKMRSVKGLHARFGILIPTDHVVKFTSEAVQHRVLLHAAILKPFYDLGLPRLTAQGEKE